MVDEFINSSCREDLRVRSEHRSEGLQARTGLDMIRRKGGFVVCWKCKMMSERTGRCDRTCCQRLRIVENAE